MRRLLVPLVLGSFVWTGAVAAAPPERVVSLHLCADQLLLKLADPDQIVSVSRYAADTTRSHMVEAAKNYPANNGTAEEVVALRPDLVIAGFLSARAGVSALRKLGYHVLELGLASDFETIRRQIGKVATALGHGDRGERLIAEMDARLAKARSGRTAKRPIAAIYQPGGFTSGKGSFENTLLDAAGFDNLAVRQGLGPLGHLGLERLVAAKPDLIINWLGNTSDPSLSRAQYSHPAMKSLVQGRWLVSLPQKSWACGGWFSVDVVERLAAIRRALEGRQQR